MSEPDTEANACRAPQWLIETSTIVGSVETYLLITRLNGWDLDTYQNWLATTYARLALTS